MCKRDDVADPDEVSAVNVPQCSAGKEATSFKVQPVVSEASSLPPPEDFVEDNSLGPRKGIGRMMLGPPLKSNLKRRHSHAHRTRDATKKSEKNRDTFIVCAERRSIQWVDNHGKQLTDVKEFEPSDSEESDTENGFAGCICAIQ